MLTINVAISLFLSFSQDRITVLLSSSFVQDKVLGVCKDLLQLMRLIESAISNCNWEDEERLFSYNETLPQSFAISGMLIGCFL